MKTILIIFTILLGSQVINAQNIKPNSRLDNSGNFIQINYLPQTEKTGKTYTDKKGDIYEVHVTKTGKYFVNLTSKTGKTYRRYLTIEAIDVAS